MPQTIYQTEGIVLSKGNFGEAETVFTLFTKEFGKIRASARGIRHLKSKLRYNLDLFSFGRFSLIAGKSDDQRFWKILDVEEASSKKNIFSDSEKLALFSRVSSLLNRMVQGEEKNLFLWNEIENIFIFLKRTEIKRDELKDLEISSLSRILGNLGYIEESSAELKHTDHQTAVFVINRAIKESML